jgi:hypothetical protein
MHTKGEIPDSNSDSTGISGRHTVFSPQLVEKLNLQERKENGLPRTKKVTG